MLVGLVRLRGDRPMCVQVKGEEEGTRGDEGLTELWIDPDSVSLRALLQTSWLVEQDSSAPMSPRKPCKKKSTNSGEDNSRRVSCRMKGRCDNQV